MRSLLRLLSHPGDALRRCLHAQVTHVFIELMEVADGPFAFKLAICDPYRFNYSSAWGIAKAMLARSPRAARPRGAR